MDKTELLMRRRNVRAFIAADPVSLVIRRKSEPVRNPNTGGYVSSGETAPLAPQTARIVQNVRRYTDGLVNAEAGEIPDSEYRLIGLHTLDLEVDDAFEWLGENYKVTGIHKARTESTFASIDLLGEDNRNESTESPIQAPVITLHPQSQSIDEGQTATFSATATGDPTPTVQWQTRGHSAQPWTNIVGATATTYVTGALSPADTGRQYRAVFSNGLVTVTNTAVITVIPADVEPEPTEGITLRSSAWGDGGTYNDGGGSLRTGNTFYTTRANGLRVLGVKFYVPPGASGAWLTEALTFYGYTRDYVGAGFGLGIDDAILRQTKTYTASRVAGEALTILFDTPFIIGPINPGAGGGDVALLMWRSASGNLYTYYNNAAFSNAVESQHDDSVFWAEAGVPQGVNNLPSNANAVWHGVDMIYEPL